MIILSVFSKYPKGQSRHDCSVMAPGPNVSDLPPSLFSFKILSKTKIHFSFHDEVDKGISAWAAVWTYDSSHVSPWSRKMGVDLSWWLSPYLCMAMSCPWKAQDAAYAEDWDDERRVHWGFIYRKLWHNVTFSVNSDSLEMRYSLGQKDKIQPFFSSPEKAGQGNCDLDWLGQGTESPSRNITYSLFM